MAEQFAAEHDEVLFVGTPQGLESRLVPQAGVRFRGLGASGFDRSRPWTLLTAILRIMLSAIRAWLWLGAERADVVIGFGGYVSIPVGLAAVMRGIPLVLHEQNSVPGLANRLLSRWAVHVCVTYEESLSYLAHPSRGILTGNPVRSEVLGSDAVTGRRVLDVDEDAKMLLVFGGSRGARHINSAIVNLRDRLLEVDNLVVMLVAGAAEAPAVRQALASAGGDAEGRFRVVDYLDAMGSAIAAADLVVARAGATSIAELTALGAACVLVPYPYATDDHQTKNARAMQQHGAAVVFSDSELDDQHFGDELMDLLWNGERRASMAAASKALGRPDAAMRVAMVARDAGKRADSSSTG